MLLNAASFAYEQKQARFDAIARGWQLGRSASRLVGLDWREHLLRPLGEVRRELRLCRLDALV